MTDTRDRADDTSQDAPEDRDEVSFPARRRRRSLSEWASAVEQEIEASIARGDFDNLPGAGKPLRWDSVSDDPETWLANHVLKNAGYVPDWLELDSAIRRERQELDNNFQKLELSFQRRSAPVRESGPDSRGTCRRAERRLTDEERLLLAEIEARAQSLNRDIESFSIAAPSSVCIAPWPVKRRIGDMLTRLGLVR